MIEPVMIIICPNISRLDLRECREAPRKIISLIYPIMQCYRFILVFLTHRSLIFILVIFREYLTY